MHRHQPAIQSWLQTVEQSVIRSERQQSLTEHVREAAEDLPFLVAMNITIRAPFRGMILEPFTVYKYELTCLLAERIKMYFRS